MDRIGVIGVPCGDRGHDLIECGGQSQAVLAAAGSRAAPDAFNELSGSTSYKLPVERLCEPEVEASIVALVVPSYFLLIASSYILLIVPSNAAPISPNGITSFALSSVA